MKRQVVRKIKPQDLTVYSDGSVTKDQSGWSFTVKQGAATIDEDTIADGYNVRLDAGRIPHKQTRDPST